MTQKALSVKAFKELANKPENLPPPPTWESAGDEAKWDLDRCHLIADVVSKYLGEEIDLRILKYTR